ncbi:uncharacterized protein PFL1_01362 [Pseudozyma flocculosa PF-1]|uniref:uncharacterized protein n=1 Tax=Pseudozyma flocculosa PF-1 TaxID=1277687 RepID=UPI0004561AE6|nr:uncharacterized protein PFL1_01362 [Pseudozyma flocculosa PF-1]EPQ31174.1 hypothetical protein PFL1_01362 [Pseudozyma flocculosa PF-1]
MSAAPTHLAQPLWQRQFNPFDPLDPLPGDPTEDPTTTDDTTTSTTRTTSSSTRTTSSSTRTTSSSSTSSTSTSSSSTSTSTSSSSSSTTTSSTSSTITSTTTSSTPTILTSTSPTVSGTSTVNVVVIETTYAPATTTVTRPTAVASSSGGSDNGALIGGVVGGVVGGLALLALVIAICITASRRRSRTGHAYFLCFGTRPSKAEKGDLGHGGGAWPTFDPNDDHHGASYGAAAAAGGGAAAAASSRRRRRQPQAQATLPPGFDGEDPEAFGQPDSSAGHDAYGGYSQNHSYGQHPDVTYNNAGYSQGHSGGGHHDMAEVVGAGALAAGAAAGGAYYGSTASRRRSSNGQPYGSNDALSSGHLSSGANHSNLEPAQPPAPWTMPMLGGWAGDQGPYSAAGVGRGPQAFHMMGPGEGGQPRQRAGGPDLQHFVPARTTHPSALTPAATNTTTSPRRSNRRLSSNQGSPSNEQGLVASPPAYVDAGEDLEEVGEERPRRLRLANAEPDNTDGESSTGGPTRPSHNHKDRPPAATYRAD